MRLAALGAERGAIDQPSSDSDTFDSVEQEVVSEVEAEGKLQFSQYLDHQRALAARASHVGVRGFSNQLSAVAQDAVTDLEREVHSGVDELFTARRQVTEAQEDLRQFQFKHQLNRPVRNQGSRGTKIGVLIFILAAETALNGLFFEKGSMQGYLGGMLMAFLVSSINVTISGAFGRFIFSECYHTNLARKMTGIIGVMLFLGLAIGFNLAVARYRIASAEDPFEASTKAYQAFIAAPLALGDMEAWFLFVLGLICSMIAALDGLTFDDPYPGYGLRSREAARAIEFYAYTKNELLNNLEDIKEEAETQLDNIPNLIRARQGEATHIVSQSHALAARLTQQFVHIQTAGNALLRQYRDSNIRARKTQVPAHFNRTWTYAPPSGDSAIVSDIDLSGYHIESEDARDVAPRARDLLHNGYRSAISAYRKIDDLTAAGVS